MMFQKVDQVCTLSPGGRVTERESNVSFQDLRRVSLWLTSHCRDAAAGGPDIDAREDLARGLVQAKPRKDADQTWLARRVDQDQRTAAVADAKMMQVVTNIPSA